jgi:putative heme-binding domain-containing protein
VRESPAEKKQAMAHLKAKLTPATLAKADLADGRALFATHCGTCHRLNDVGGTIGPDLTGSNRDNLDYLIENILDPSAVVTADFRVTTVALHDGRLLNGIVKTRTPQAITLQLEKEQVTVRTSDIESERPSDQSLMAEGILNTLKEDQIRNLFGYLMRR